MKGAVWENSLRIYGAEVILPRHLSQNTLCIHAEAPFLSNKASNHFFGTLNEGVSSPYQAAVTNGMQCWEQNVGLHWQNCELSITFLTVDETVQSLGRLWY